MRGNDLRGHAIKDVIILPDSQVVQMIFCFETFAVAEEIYIGVFNADVDIGGIIEELAEGMTRALQVLAYAAIAVANKGVTFEQFLKNIYTKESETLLRFTVIENIHRMLRDSQGVYDGEDNSSTDFPWDLYYLAALNIGLSDADFWAATPRKLWLLTRDKEADERSVQLTKMYV